MSKGALVIGLTQYSVCHISVYDSTGKSISVTFSYDTFYGSTSSPHGMMNNWYCNSSDTWTFRLQCYSDNYRATFAIVDLNNNVNQVTPTRVSSKTTYKGQTITLSNFKKHDLLLVFYQFRPTLTDGDGFKELSTLYASVSSCILYRITSDNAHLSFLDNTSSSSYRTRYVQFRWNI